MGYTCVYLSGPRRFCPKIIFNAKSPQKLIIILPIICKFLTAVFCFPTITKPQRDLTLLLRIILFCALLLSVPASHAVQSQPRPLPGSHTAVAYMTSGGVGGYNVDTYMHPASTQKVLTALAAVLHLGNDYTFKTRLAVSSSAVKNKKVSVSKGTLNGDVMVRFTGDPTLTVEKYKKLLTELKNRGISNITGRVYLDVSRFGDPSRATGWSWDDLPVCFTAPSSPIILNRNCTYAQVQPHGAGNKVTPVVPRGTPIELITDAIGVNAKNYGGDCKLEANLYFGNKYHITGCVPIQRKNKAWPLSLAVSDANQWGIDWTRRILSNLGIKVKGGIHITKRPRPQFTTISRVTSNSLRELVKYMLQKSNNLYADAIAKNTAYEFYNRPATYHRTSQAIRSILRQYADINIGKAYIVDGSGLSPHNLLCPRDLLKVLDYIRKNDSKLNLLASFPVSGTSGTMRWRASSRDAPLRGNVIAKTGTLQNVSNLAGFIRSRSGGLVPFVMFTNAITYDQRTRDRVKARRIASPHYGYEKHVLMSIYNGQNVPSPH